MAKKTWCNSETVKQWNSNKERERRGTGGEGVELELETHITFKEGRVNQCL